MKSKIDWLIAGLGNPGKVYAENRHNIGWMTAAALCEKYKRPVLGYSPLFLLTSLRINSSLVLVAMPTTYMNNSGEALAAICNEFDIPIDRIVVIVDEYNFPLGKLHLRKGGGDGGHNGINSIIEELGSRDFLRLRCGIDRNFETGGLVDYVLSDFRKEEISERDKMIIRAVESIEYLVRMGPERAMSAINSRELWSEEEYKNIEPFNIK